MEICNESLVYYALRNPESREYLNIVDEQYYSCGLNDATKFTTLNKVKEQIEKYPKFNEIRRVKVVDIGKINEDI